MPSTTELRVWMYRQMLRSRYFEDHIMSIYTEGKTPVFDWAAGPIPGEMHLSYGQEAVSSGVCAALEPRDWLHAAHRPHHMAIARGVDLQAMAAEIFGKKSGLSGGRGGHMHIYDRRVNFLSSAIVGEQMGAAAGFAWAAKARKSGGVAVAVVGDGAANQGAFHEVLNLASIYHLPLICVIEDNDLAVTTTKRASTAVAHNSDRAVAYSMAGEYVAGNDPDVILTAVRKAVDRARTKNEPTLLEVQTIRLKGHFLPDSAEYVTKAVRDAWTDCVAVYRAKLLKEGAASESALNKIESETHAEVDAAIDFARKSPYPELESALQCVFAAAPAAEGVRT
jgi:acetoin:2,6-dichlorophenolindophenol oxidoreductase subunit alpha